MALRLFKNLTILAVTVLIAGCKLNLVVPTGGDVTSASGTRHCAGGTVCEFIIANSTFNESFTAVPRPGYVFSKWADGFQCGNSTNPVCTINNTGYVMGSNAAVDSYIQSGAYFYAMPLFSFVGISGDVDKDHVVDTKDNCIGVYGNSVWGCVISGNDSDGDSVANYLDWVVLSDPGCTAYAWDSDNGCRWDSGAQSTNSLGITDRDVILCWTNGQSSPYCGRSPF